MMLPILISESLAPGSYFFSAFDAVVVIAAAAKAARTNRLRTNARIIVAPCGSFAQVWQAPHGDASIRFFRAAKRHCCRRCVIARSEATKQSSFVVRKLDCFAALAMTAGSADSQSSPIPRIRLCGVAWRTTRQRPLQALALSVGNLRPCGYQVAPLAGETISIILPSSSSGA